MKSLIKHNFNLVAQCVMVLAASQLFSGAARADDAATIADLKARLAAVERDLGQLVESDSKGSTGGGIPVHGFADVGYTHSSNNDTRIDQAGHGFWANSLDFYLTPQFTDRSKALIELIFEFAPDGGLATDLERIQLGYTFSDRLTTWIGRFHAPYGYWNTAFHHGAQIQTSITRPRFIDFEDKGGLLPSHVMGGWATGDVRLGNSSLTYDLYVGNGNAIETGSIGGHDGTLAINNSRDSNNNSLVGANVGYKMGGMVVGAHAFSQRVDINDGSTGGLGEVGVKMTGLYGAYEDDNWESIVEYYRFKNDDRTVPGITTANSSWLGFAQLGVPVGDKLMPYLRLEKASLDQDDPYFNTQAYGYSYKREVVGVRYMLNDKGALKLEVNRTKEGDGVATSGLENGRYTEVRVQYAIRF